MLEKLKRMPTEGSAVWVDPAGYKAAVAERQQAFEAELAKQKARRSVQSLVSSESLDETRRSSCCTGNFLVFSGFFHNNHFAHESPRHQGE